MRLIKRQRESDQERNGSKRGEQKMCFHLTKILVLVYVNKMVSCLVKCVFVSNLSPSRSAERAREMTARLTLVDGLHLK